MIGNGDDAVVFDWARDIPRRERTAWSRGPTAAHRCRARGLSPALRDRHPRRPARRIDRTSRPAPVTSRTAAPTATRRCGERLARQRQPGDAGPTGPPAGSCAAIGCGQGRLVVTDHRRGRHRRGPDRRAGRDAGRPGHAAARQVVLVSSGAIAAGLAPLGLPRRPRDLATQQAAASVGQGLLVARYSAAFARHGVRTGQVLLTADDLMRRAHYRNAQRTLARLLELGVLPIVNENDTVATDEIRFGDNDRLAALVAHVVRAGRAGPAVRRGRACTTADPRLPGARRIPEVRSQADLAGVTLGRAGAGHHRGRYRRHGDQGGCRPDRHRGGHPRPWSPAPAAARDALAGEAVGTYFAPAGRRPAARQLWLAHATGRRGRLPARRRARRPRSGRAARPCCPPGSPAWTGGFDAGDPVDLCDPAGQVDRPRAGQLRRRRDSGHDGPVNAATWPPSWGRSTSGRSCTATTWYCWSARAAGPAERSLVERWASGETAGCPASADGSLGADPALGRMAWRGRRYACGSAGRTPELGARAAGSAAASAGRTLSWAPG